MATVIPALRPAFPAFPSISHLLTWLVFSCCLPSDLKWIVHPKMNALSSILFQTHVTFYYFFHEMQKEMFWILVTLLHTMKTDQAKKGWTKRKTKKTIQVCMTWMQYWKSSNNSFMWGNLATVHWKVFFFCCSKIRIINLINIKHEKFLEIVILLVPYVFENIFITWNKINKT